jgi:3-oxoacyl-[acyl-carrier-protein] synthase-3
LRAISVAYPENVRTNAYYRETCPDIVAQSEQHNLARVWSAPDTSPDTAEHDAAMQPYLSDPFRGSVERRILAPGELPSMLELRAARATLAAAGVEPKDVDLMLVGSFLPDRIGTGNSALLARELGLRGAAWNVESACSTSVVAMQTACSLVASGAFRNALVVVSCTYSRTVEDRDTLGWFLGDGAGAFFIDRVPEGEGLLGSYIVHTGESWDAAWYEPVANPDGSIPLRMRAGKGTGRLFREMAGPLVRECCHAAVERAGVRLEDIALFAFNTPTAWHARLGANCLGVDPERVIDLYARFANIGPALTTSNLYYAAQEGRLRPGDLVLAFSIGSVSTSGAFVLRWGDVALGPPPA